MLIIFIFKQKPKSSKNTEPQEDDYEDKLGDETKDDDYDNNYEDQSYYDQQDQKSGEDISREDSWKIKNFI